MFGRLGWAEILVIVVLVVILFGHRKIPGMMKNLADGLNVFKKELKAESKKPSDGAKQSGGKETVAKPAGVAKKRSIKKK